MSDNNTVKKEDSAEPVPDKTPTDDSADVEDNASSETDAVDNVSDSNTTDDSADADTSGDSESSDETNSTSDSGDGTDYDVGDSSDASSADSDGADYDIDSGSDNIGKPEDVAANSSLLFKALSGSVESFNDDTRITQSSIITTDSLWNDMMNEFTKWVGSNKSIKPVTDVNTYGVANEALNLSSFGFTELQSVWDEETKFAAKVIIDKLPDNVTRSFQNCVTLTDQSIISLDKLLTVYRDKVSSGDVQKNSFSWGAYSRQFMCGGKSINSMGSLLAVANQQMLLHHHIAKDGYVHLTECATAILTFLKTIKEDTLWNDAFKRLTVSLSSADNKLHPLQNALVERTNAFDYPPIAPEVLRRRKTNAVGKALVSILDSVYYCRHSPKIEVTKLSDLVNYGISIEQDLSAPKNTNTGIDLVTNPQMVTLLTIAKRTALIVKGYQANILKIVELLTKIKEQYKQINSYTDYHLSPQKKEELYFIGIYLMEIVTNPHIANLWQAMRLVHTGVYLSNQLLPRENLVFDNFKGFEMKHTKILMNALENLVDVPDSNVTPVTADTEASTPIGEADNDPVNTLSGMDVHPEDQAALDENVKMTEESNELGNSITALEGLQNNCEHVIKYGTPSEQRRAIVTINASHRAICSNLGIRIPATVALESEHGEVVALEGLFSAIGDTIKNVIQSVKNLWNNWMTKLEENRLRDKAAAGDLSARLNLIGRKRQLLVEAAGEEYTNKAVINNIGLYGKMDTALKAITAVHDLHSDFSEYSNASMKFADVFYASISRSSNTELREAIVGDIAAFRDMVFPEKKNPHAVTPHLTKGQAVTFTRQVPGNGALALVMPDEVYNDKYSSDCIDEIRIVDLSSGVRRDALGSIKAATDKDFTDLSDAIEKWSILVEKNYVNWNRLYNGVNRAEDLANYVYQNIQGSDKDAVQTAKMYYRYLAYFLPQVLTGFNIRSTLSYTVFSAVMTWMEESIVKAEEIIKSRPSVNTN